MRGYDSEPAQSDTFGDVLRRYRLAAGLTQEELAERAGLSVRAISDLERGIHHAPYRDTVRLLVDALGLTSRDAAPLEVAARRRATASPSAPGSIDSSVGALAPTDRGPGQSTDAAPVRTSSLSVTTLPRQLTRFVGREREVEAVRQRLLQPETLLLTLIGAGGTGKTRLAHAVAATVGDAFPDGVVVVPLATLADSRLVLATIAWAVGVTETAGLTLIECLVLSLDHSRTLLILDNFEHLLAAAPELTVVLAGCAHLKLLVTSRMPLHVHGERIVEVPPLTVPGGPPPPPPEVLAQFEAVRLFVERARDVKSDFALTTENAWAVAEICARLDGLPLAIELAAAHIRMLPPPLLLARLESRLTLLTRGGRDRPARHQTLRGTIDWSYNLLDEDERRLFARLAVFPAGATLEAVEAVCAAANSPLDGLAGCEALVDKGLLRNDDGVAGEPRVVMLETIREYALERLLASGEVDDVRRRHALHLLGKAEAASAALAGPEQAIWLARLEREHDNLRAALQWARDNRENVIGLRLAGALWPFWQRHCHLSEGRRWLEELLAADHDRSAPSERRANALTGAAWLAHDQDDFARADALFDEGLTLDRALGHAERVADVLAHRGVMLRGQGQYAQARSLVEEALALHRTRGNREGIAYALFRLGLITREEGDYARATSVFEECLALYQALGDRGGAAFALLGLGDIARDRGDPARVRTYCEESRSICLALGRQWGIGFSLNNLALAAAMEGDSEPAEAMAEDALRLFRAHGVRGGIVEALMTLGQLACARAAFEVGRKVLLEGLALGWPTGPHWLVATGLEEIARVAVARGDAVRAARLCGAAAAWRERMGAPLQPYRQASYEATRASARQALGADAFAAASAAGAGLRPDEAIADARELAE